MSDDRHLPHAPVLAENIPEEWTTMLHHDLARQRTPMRAGVEPVIELQSLTSGQWHPLMLPAGGGTRFTSAAERDKVMARIENPPPPQMTA